MRTRFFLAMFFVVPAQGAATIYNLGTLPGGEYTRAYGINASGQVVGCANTANGDHAFLYTGTPGSGGAMYDLGTLQDTELQWNSQGLAINSVGQIAGSSDTIVNWDYVSHAILYTGTPGNSGVMYDLGTLGGNDSFANAINASGQVAGVSDRIKGSYGTSHAFLYSGIPGSGGGMRDLGTLGGAYSEARALNDSGLVAGLSSTTAGAQHAFLYTGTPGSDGVMRDLGTLGGTSSTGKAINASGQVVGYSQITGDAASHAFLYTGMPGSGGQMIDLGTLGGAYSSASAINNHGQVVGSSGTTGGVGHLFLYTGTPGVDGEMIDLSAWLTANNPVEGAKWWELSPVGLTDTGLITGEGSYYDGPGGLSDGIRAFLLDASTLLFTPGDANNDGVINSIDFDFLAANYGTLSGATWAMGDFDGDDKVTTTDFNLLAGHFGGSGSSVGAIVPEPSSLGLLVGITFILRRRNNAR